MSTTGQIVGGVVGGIVGAFAGAPMLGVAIGMSIGGYIDPPKGPKGNPPSASDLAVQTATYGAPLGDGDGTYGTLGNVFWVEGNSLRAEEHQAEGGKGGAPTGPSTYDIYGTFAVGFGEGEIDGYGRIWFSSKLVCDYTSSDMGAILATSENGGNITLYTGSMSQLPDDRIQADMGAANTPAYRGLHYIVVKDWPMADFGNSLMGLQVKAEIINDGTISQYARRLYIPSGLFDPYGTEYGPFNPRIESGLFKFNKNSSEYTVDYTGRVISVTSSSVDFGTPFFIGKFPSGAVIWYDHTVSAGGGSLYIGESIFKQRIGNTTDALCGAFVGDNGLLYLLMATAGVGRLEIYDEHLTLLSTQAQSVYYDDNVISLPALPGVEHTFCVENNGAYLWYSITYGGENWMRLYSIPASGPLTQLWQYYPTAFYGPYGDKASVAAADGVCYHVSNGGSLAIFDRARIVSSALVPLADIIERRSLKSGLLESSDIDVSEITQTVRGYKVSSIGTIRSSLEPLQAAWPFDAIPHGYQIKYVPRGNSSVATIDIGELGCVSGAEKPGVRITASREMDSQLPRKVIVTYLDVNREYDLNTGPGSERMNTDAVSIEQIELPIVMNATDAAQAEEVLLYLRWLERHDVSFILPPTYLHLEAADVITINGNSATYELRLTQINYLPDGRMECSAKFNNVAVYTSVAVAQEGLSPIQVLSYAGPTVAELLDVPCVDSSVMDRPGMLSAATGYFTGWPGATLFRSDDSGQSWLGAQGFLPPGAVIGSARNVISSVSRYSVDLGSTLVVWLSSGGLSSVTQDAMLNGANHFAYGAHGRWEIIAAQNCTQQADDSWHLTNLLRGRFGTEQYMGTHAEDDVIVLLDQAVVRFIGMDIASLGVSKLWRPVTTGRSFDTSVEIPIAYSGTNLKPLSPVDLNGNRNISNLDWTFYWTPRTRTPVEIFSGFNMPLGESSASYEVEIWTAGHALLKRTISGLSSPSCPYSATDQATDLGSPQETVSIKVYQISASVGRGFPLVESITRILPLDPFIGNVKLLLHMEGSNGSTTFTDVFGHSVTAAGNAKITTTDPLYGTSSYLGDGTGDWLVITDASDLELGSGDFCLECSFKLSGYSNNYTGVYFAALIAKSAAGAGNSAFYFGVTGTASTWHSLFFSVNGDTYTATVPYAFSLNTLYRASVCRDASNLRFFVEGVQVGTTQSISITITNNTTDLTVGGMLTTGYTCSLPGRIDEVRITKAARYTADYVPASAAFPNS